MNKVLFLSYYFPPMGMGGTQRSAKFVKYLPAFNWEPVVITVKDVKYQINIKRVIARGLILGIADGSLLADGKEIYTAKNLRVGLFTSTDNF